MKTTLAFFLVILLAMGGSLFAQQQNFPSGTISTQVPVTCASSMTFTAGATFVTDFFTTLNCNVTSSTVAGTLTTGNEIVISLTQDSTGGRTFTWPANFVNTPIVNTAPSGSTVAGFQYCGAAGNGTSCPAGSWAAIDVGPTGLPTAASSIIDARVYGAVGNGINCADMSWGNSSSTLTSASQCTFVNAAFPAGDVGKSVFGTNNCQVGTVAVSTSSVVVPLGTISSVSSAHVIVVSTTSTASVASNGCIVYGTFQDTGLAAADTVAQAATGCPTIIFPEGIIMYQAAHFITQPPACAKYGGVTGQDPFGVGMRLLGQGKSVTILNPAPGFNAATCTGGPSGTGCILGMPSAALENLTINGFGNVNDTMLNGKTFLDLGYQTKLQSAGFLLLDSKVGGTMIGTRTSSSYSMAEDCVWDGFGSPMLQINGTNFLMHNSVVTDGYNSNGEIQVTAGSQFTSTGGLIFSGGPGSSGAFIIVSSSSVLNLANGDNVTPGGGGGSVTPVVSIDATSFLFISGDSVTIGATTPNVTAISNAGTAVLQGINLSILGGGTGVGLNNSGKVYDAMTLGGFGNGVTNTGTWFGSTSVTGFNLVNGNVVLSAGFGTTATVTNSTGPSRGFTFQANSSGAGQAANPTMTVTFPRAFWVAPTGFTCKMTGGTGTITNITGETTATTTTMTLTFNGTPAAGVNYIISCGLGN